VDGAPSAEGRSGVVTEEGLIPLPLVSASAFPVFSGVIAGGFAGFAVLLRSRLLSPDFATRSVANLAFGQHVTVALTECGLRPLSFSK